MSYIKSNLPILDCRSLTMAQGEGHVNETLDLSDEKYEKPQIHGGDDGEGDRAELSKGGGGLPFAVIAVREDEDDDGFEDLERTPNTFTDAIERAQVGDE